MRRRANRSSSEQSADIDMTPMLDIVFIMLIFFIVTTSFVKESGIDVNRPSAKTGAIKAQGNIIVGIKANGDVWIDKRLVDFRAVRANVSRLHMENPLGSVIIAADRETKTQDLVQVIDQIRLAGIMNPAIATESESQ
ncbi:biopolymer transport protein ExbD [Bathymodiolus platifrons methanotrophic gill symbiont]|uniref:ExbD/TolR family protein n=1 Tax=Bathymodiolus platifrons methanotrophic gill symbiont TaxID=113268 RepID=UPI000B414AAD|nr:biopolymer transporter ExbD [Bathymodiolus platifrons methanotrophic gill symbiont]MCK5870294.1 biopolymer transporter ExbD [Methyloprofundus sp.]TXK94763.1 biopolymer transporter ExbD [Methylococcaceae bacterium CS5]TXK95098.1 biopolymer transporter ExbD [Methylococcaceae bacterium CS4]TXL02117.1 biopolymer transporter ExbD [Methylococcaceae bacterium HT1]TXL03977.1 biopolymer transporter ExbD [Methylococcaceae bacterium CS1]TXL04446.1 biopolymer transporter ExbD [Methylococcaceae bacteri